MPLAGKELKNYEALPGVLGNTGSMAFISGEQGNQGQILRGTGEQTQYWGTGNTRKHILDFWGQGNKPIYFRGTREQVPPPPPPPREGLNYRDNADVVVSISCWDDSMRLSSDWPKGKVQAFAEVLFKIQLRQASPLLLVK